MSGRPHGLQKSALMRPVGRPGTRYFRHPPPHQLGDQDYALRRVVREALVHLDDAAEKGQRRREPARRLLHLRDVTYRSGRTAHTLPLWRGPVVVVSGWTLGEPDKD
ncbi:hypothetical protein ACIRST_41925 [Kitasatospora sp. NPDC101447]|uniref:hypothetical protein n=1 Tax=Kitasatospora sp. NPDC101447 TaxID=3364102 RepID=UPI0037FF3EB5